MPWIPTVSPTQIDDFNLCERKWGLRTLVKGAYVQNIGAARGDFGHKMLEAWGKDRTPPENFVDEFAIDMAMRFHQDLDEKRISAVDYAERLAATVNKMTVLLPEPPFAAIERDFRVKIQGVLWSGRKDLEFPESVYDYKFTSSPDYAKTKAQLPHDPQALTYAFEKFYREAKSSVTVRLIYGHVTSKPRAWVVEHTFTPEEAAANIAPYTETAKRIVKLRLQRPDPLSLTPNWKACPHFGGCNFQDRCKPTVDQLVEAYAAMAMGEPPTKPTTGESPMGLLSQIAGSQAAAVPGTTGQAPAVASAGTEARSDSNAAVADLIRDATALLRLGIARAEVVKNMQSRYVGLAAVADALVPLAAPPKVEETPAPVEAAKNTPAPAVNSGPPPGVEPKQAEEPKAATKTRTSKAAPAPLEVGDLRLGDVLASVGKRILDETDTGKAASAALALVQAFKLL